MTLHRARKAELCQTRPLCEAAPGGGRKQQRISHPSCGSHAMARSPMSAHMPTLWGSWLEAQQVLLAARPRGRRAGWPGRMAGRGSAGKHALSAQPRRRGDQSSGATGRHVAARKARLQPLTLSVISLSFCCPLLGLKPFAPSRRPLALSLLTPPLALGGAPDPKPRPRPWHTISGELQCFFLYGCPMLRRSRTARVLLARSSRIVCAHLSGAARSWLVYRAGAARAPLGRRSGCRSCEGVVAGRQWKRTPDRWQACAQ